MARTRSARLPISAAAFGLGAALSLTAGLAAASPVNPTLSAAPIDRPQSFADLIEKVAPAVVSIDIKGKVEKSPINYPAPFGGPGVPDLPGLPPELRQLLRPPGPAKPTPVEGTGSGFFISADGYILTNNHVVEHADSITVRTKDGKSYPAKLVGRDPATDLAVVKIDHADNPFVTFEDSAKPRVGDWVVAVGNPYNLGGTATAGIISALGRQNVSGSSFVDYMQIDAPINRGNSGGPTFDVQGRVVGVNAAIVTPSGGSVGIGFDIPADVAARVSHELIATGTVRRGFIGARIQNVTPDLAASMGQAPGVGALIAEVTPGGPAEKAGLRSGDLVLQADGQAVTSASDLTRRVAQAPPGTDLRVLVSRDGGQRTFTLHTGLRPSEQALASNSPLQPEAPDAPAEAPVLGMHLVPNGSGGVTVSDVDSDSDAAQKGLAPGDVIIKAGAVQARTPADVRAGVEAARKLGRKDVLVLVSRNGAQRFVPISTTPEAPAAKG